MRNAAAERLGPPRLHQGLVEVGVEGRHYCRRSRGEPCFRSTGMIERIKFIGVLGFRILTDQAFGLTQRWIELSIPGAETGISFFTPSRQEGGVYGSASETPLGYFGDYEGFRGELDRAGFEVG